MLRSGVYKFPPEAKRQEQRDFRTLNPGQLDLFQKGFFFTVEQLTELTLRRLSHSTLLAYNATSNTLLPSGDGSSEVPEP